MDAAIARAPVQICDVNYEPPTDLFCKKSLIYIFTKEIDGLFGIYVTDLNRSAGNGCVHRSWRCVA